MTANEEPPAYADAVTAVTNDNEIVHPEVTEEKKANTNDVAVSIKQYAIELEIDAKAAEMKEANTTDETCFRNFVKVIGLCKECCMMVRNWPKSLKIYCVIGTLLFYMAIIGSIEGPVLLNRGNKYKPHSHTYPFEIQCLITADKSIESSVYGCNTGAYQAALYEDFIYYQPKCSMINETFSDEQQRRIQTGDSCEDEFDSEAGPLRNSYNIEVNSTMDCYANRNCTAITFYDYIHWKSYHTQGALWLSVTAVFSCAVFCWLAYERCYNNDKLGANQCCYCGCIMIFFLMLPIYGGVKFALWIDSTF